MIWRFSDGTTVELGGTVRGASLLAQELRAELDAGEVLVAIYPTPSEDVVLDPQDPALLDAWLQDQAARPHRREDRIRLVERPEGIPELPPVPDDNAEPDERGQVVY